VITPGDTPHWQGKSGYTVLYARDAADRMMNGQYVTQAGDGAAASAYRPTNDTQAYNIVSGEHVFGIIKAGSRRPSYRGSGSRRYMEVLSALNGYVPSDYSKRLHELRSSGAASGLTRDEIERLHMLAVRASLWYAGVAVTSYSYQSSSQHQTGLVAARSGVFPAIAHVHDMVPGARVRVRPPTLSEALAMKGVEGKGLNKVTLITEQRSSRSTAANLSTLLKYDLRFGPDASVGWLQRDSEHVSREASSTDFQPVSRSLQQFALTAGLMFLWQWLNESASDAVGNPFAAVRRLLTAAGNDGGGVGSEHVVAALAVGLRVVEPASPNDPLFKTRDGSTAIAGLDAALQSAAAAPAWLAARQQLLEAQLLGASALGSQQATFGASGEHSLQSVDHVSSSPLQLLSAGRLLREQQNSLTRLVAALDDYIDQENQFDVGVVHDGGVKNGPYSVDYTRRG
jgi:hypothetical protein